MNWKIIVWLSLLGLFMALGTVTVISSQLEPFFWLPILVASAWIIGSRVAARPFLHGLCVGVANSVWMTGAHVIFAEHYLSTHAQEAEMMKSMPAPDAPRLMMLLVGPIAGVVSGILIGLLAMLAFTMARSRKAA